MAAITSTRTNDGFRLFEDPFVAVVAVTAITAALAPAASGPPGPASVVVLVAVVALLGIPHGAVDHLVAEVLSGEEPGRSGPEVRRRFQLRYVAAMLGCGLLWLAAPGVALAAFLVASVHHFGQSDLAHLGLSPLRQVLLQWSRGLFVVGLPLVAHLPAVSPTIEALGGGDPASWAWLADRAALWCGVLVVQHVVVGAAFLRGSSGPEVFGREALTVIVLGVLFVRADPLVGFAVYFGLWHSLNHLRVLAAVLGAASSPDGAPLSLPRLLRLSAPRAVPTLVLLAVLVGGSLIAGRPDLVLPASLVLVSLVTPPHLVVVERLWRGDRPVAGAASAA